MKLLLLSLLILSIGIPGVIDVHAINDTPTYNPLNLITDNCHNNTGNPNQWWCYVDTTPTQKEIDYYNDVLYDEWWVWNCHYSLVGLTWCDYEWNAEEEIKAVKFTNLQKEGKLCEWMKPDVDVSPLLYCYEPFLR